MWIILLIKSLFSIYITLHFLCSKFRKIKSPQLIFLPSYTFKPCSMDPRQIQKIQAMNRYKKRQFMDNLNFYFLSALSCSVFCYVTLCLPYLSSIVSVFFFVHIPSLIPVLLSTKLLFIIGNIIIFFLVVNSKIFSSDPSSTCVVYYDEYIQSSQTMKPQISTPEVKECITILEKCVGKNVDMMTWEEGVKSVDLKGKGWVEKATEASKEEENVDGGDEQSLIHFCSDELNKRADDFIARVNRQRRLELSLLNYDRQWPIMVLCDEGNLFSQLDYFLENLFEKFYRICVTLQTIVYLHLISNFPEKLHNSFSKHILFFTNTLY